MPDTPNRPLNERSKSGKFAFWFIVAFILIDVVGQLMALFLPWFNHRFQ